MTDQTAVVTLLFTDIVGSTASSQRLGEDQAERVRREHISLLREAIAVSGGREVKNLGDGLMVVFDTPSAAATCAQAMQIAVDRHNRAQPHPLGLRVGVHTGEVTREEEDYFGTAVVVAERLCNRCDAGQVYVSDVVRMLVGSRGGLRLKEVGALELKGITEPVTAHELHWERPAEVDEAQEGRDACDTRAWVLAHNRLAAADRRAPLAPADLELLALASYMVGRDDEAADAWTRAHGLWLDLDRGRAARCALWYGNCLLFKGDVAPAMGWIARGARALDELDECVEHAFLLVLSGMETLFGGDPHAALDRFARASEIAERFDDRDMVTYARLATGQARLMSGDTQVGVSLFDEVMAAVIADEVHPIIAGIAYCQVIATCHDLFDLRRAWEWTAALSRWCDSQPGMVPFRGNCLVHRCEVMQLQGAWGDAIDAAREACRLLSGWDTFGAAQYQLGELHRLRGEFEEAEEAYRRASRAGRQPDPGMSLLRLAQGRTRPAVGAIDRALAQTDDPCTRARYLPAHVEIMLAAGDSAAARRSAQELRQLATQLDALYLDASASQATGRVQLAAGDPRGALISLRAAWRAWTELDARHEAARSRVLIGLACRAVGDGDAADMEFAGARAAFEEIGAVPDLEQLGRAIEEVRARGSGSLTPRELEILTLVASGKTNKAIAAELVLSEKTVIRHVSNIFTKLDVSSRSAATAYAYEHGLV